MKCYFELCIYQKDNACTLDSDGAEINDLGMCEHCEIITVDEDYLSATKKRRLDEINEIWADDDKVGVDAGDVVKAGVEAGVEADV